jgi:hypothetical protein
MMCTKINLKDWIAGLPPSYQSSLDKALVYSADKWAGPWRVFSLALPEKCSGTGQKEGEQLQ